MTSRTFYRTCLRLWGEDWRPELLALLANHGLKYSRMSVWNWREGVHPVPNDVADILENKRKAG